MTTTMCDLPHDLIGEKILTKVPITSLIAVRCACKLWNALSKEFIVGSQTSRQHEFLGFMMISNQICPFRFDIEGIHIHDNLVDLSMKQVGLPDQVEISKVFHCDGLLLCVTNDENSKLLVWNPYLGKKRWIRPREYYEKSDLYAIGYDNNREVRNYKILRLGNSYYYGESVELEIYDFSSDSWSVLNVLPDCRIHYFKRGVTLKGCNYIFGSVERTSPPLSENCLLCFDYTRERYGERLPLPFNTVYIETVAISVVRGENLAAFYFDFSLSVTLEIWVTDKIEHDDAVSWSKFFKVDMMKIQLRGLMFDPYADIFFVDEENKVAVIIANSPSHSYKILRPTAYIIGEDGYYNSVKIGEVNLTLPRELYLPLVLSPYIPSLVQINR